MRVRGLVAALIMFAMRWRALAAIVSSFAITQTLPIQGRGEPRPSRTIVRISPGLAGALIRPMDDGLKALIETGLFRTWNQPGGRRRS
jgi:hypothetical protein